jgi:FlaA1/EpsC-like NDP-sugar epimerase
MISGQRILITGAGSIGRNLLSRFLDDDPDVIRIFDSSESTLAELQSSFDDGRLRFLAGNVRDADRLERATEDIDIIVHTAAMKHVDVCEYNPFEAVKSNALGVQNLLDAAIDEGVKRVVFTSSDKAVDPANTMGTTKLLGEKLVTAANKYRGERDITLASVRFGNVINSSQSVVPLFTRQIREGGPVTLTDERMTRFFLTYDDVAALVKDALRYTDGGEVFVSKMPAIRIEDLAEAMIETLAPEYGHDPADIDIEVVGRRVGETFHEEIMTEHEMTRAVENESTYAILPETNHYLNHSGLDGFEEATDIVRSSGEAGYLAKEEIVSMLEDTGSIGVVHP